ncbi:MAG: tetratricopeptide repeat protein [Pseudomonadota bacterium]
MRIQLQLFAATLAATMVAANAEDSSGRSPTNANFGEAIAAVANGAVLGSTKFLADVGDPRSQHMLSTAYRLGTHGDVDQVLAVVWLRKAAAQAYPAALSEMAYHYHTGTLGFEKDTAKALDFFEQAATLDDAYAQAMLGRAYLYGDMGLLKDPETALLFLKPAAQQDNTSALVDLGHMYRIGNVVPRDLHQAKDLYQKAANQGSAQAQHNLATLFWEFEEFKDEPSAIHWYTQAVAQHYAPSYYKLGEIYRRGDKAHRNLTKALGLYLRGADLNEPYANTMLGYLYANGVIVKKDEDKAETYYRAGAELGHAEAQARLGVMYMDDAGSVKDGLEWLLKACVSGNQRAKNHLEYLVLEDEEFLKNNPNALSTIEAEAIAGYVHGQVLLGWHEYRSPVRNYKKALNWFEMAAKQDDAEAQYAMFYMQYNQQGTQLDAGEARTWLMAAAENQLPEALYGLARAYHYGNSKIDVDQDSSKAVAYFRLAHSHGVSQAANELAWLLSTNPDDALRDGEEAIRIMEDAIADQSRSDQWVDTLAAAYAEAGDFDNAISHQLEAITLAEQTQTDSETLSEFRQRLAAYEARQPWRDDSL